MSISTPAASDSGITVPNASDLAELGHAVADMKRQVAALEARVIAASPPTPVVAALDRIMDLTAELFPGPAVLRRDFDPDFPNDQWLVMEVEATGTVREILDREIDWHRRLDSLDPSIANQFRLCLFPK